VAKPVRFPRSRLLKRDELHRAATIANANIRAGGGILLVLDADEDCAAELCRSLQGQLESAFPRRTCRVVLPVREFEAWLVGGLPEFGESDPDRAGKLKDRIRERRGVYSETVDQPRLSREIDVQRLRETSRSFRRLCRVVGDFVEQAGIAARGG
jgi:hypothetical protein